MSELIRFCADNTKAEKLFEWGPNYTRREGLKLGNMKSQKLFSKESKLHGYKSEIYNF